MSTLICVRFEIFMVVKIQVEVFWHVIPCSVQGEDGASKVHQNVDILQQHSTV